MLLLLLALLRLIKVGVVEAVFAVVGDVGGRPLLVECIPGLEGEEGLMVEEIVEVLVMDRVPDRVRVVLVGTLVLVTLAAASGPSTLSMSCNVS